MPSSPNTRPSNGIAPPEHRLPDKTRLGRVQLQIANLERSLRFYGDVLGLFHVALRLPDRAALGRLVRHLADTDVEIGMSDHRVSEAIYLNDPDGLGIEVYADRPRSRWTYDADGQLEMTTEPLDVQSLIDAAGETSWTSAPAGTDVGHVHLHVGDLGRAAAFYHEALGLDKTGPSSSPPAATTITSGRTSGPATRPRPARTMPSFWNGRSACPPPTTWRPRPAVWTQPATP